VSEALEDVLEGITEDELEGGTDDEADTDDDDEELMELEGDGLESVNKPIIPPKPPEGVVEDGETVGELEVEAGKLAGFG